MFNFKQRLWKVIVSISLFLSATSCTELAKKVFPNPQIIEHEYKPKLFGTDEGHITIHNTGSDGKVFIKLTRGEDTYTKSLYFSKDERRTVVIKMTGNSDAEYIEWEVIAEELKSHLDNK